MAEVKDILGPNELKSCQEWLDSWGPSGSPTWNDETGVSIPVTKTQFQKLLNTVEHWKQRAAKHGCDTENGDPDCG